MASTPSRGGGLSRDKNEAVRGTTRARENEALRHPTRATRSSTRVNAGPPQYITNFNYNFDSVQISNGTIFGLSPGEDVPQSRKPRPALPAMRGQGAPQVQRRGRIIPNEDEEPEEDEDEIDSTDDEPSELPLIPTTSPTSTERVQTWQDSAYGSSRRGSKPERNEVYRASSINRSSNRPPAEAGSSQKKRRTKEPSVESNVEDSATSEDNGTHVTAQGDDGGEDKKDGEEDNKRDNSDDSEDSDDDFAHRDMYASTIDHKRVAVNVILDTGTKPNWISKNFLTETLRLKYTKLTEEKEYSDFNGKKFTAIGKAKVMIDCTDFNSDFQIRIISFLVAKGNNFKILLGSKTIQKERLFTKPVAPEGEAVYPAVQIDAKKPERAVVAHNRERQDKEGAERDKKTKEALKARMRETKESKPLAARLAQESKPRRTRVSPSPSRDAKYAVTNGPKSSWKKTRPPLHERSSSASSSGGGAALDD